MTYSLFNPKNVLSFPEKSVALNPNMMNRKRLSIGVLVALLAASTFSSIHSYRNAQDWVMEDMNQALVLTMAQQQTDVISADTIRVFNSHLQLKELRGKATLAVDTRQKKFTCYAKCSSATIFSLSDQRPATVLWSLALAWGLFCLYLKRKEKTLLPQECRVYGGLTYSDTQGQFLNSLGEPVRLTPMQQQLLEMFFRAPMHQLTKTEICDALWPKKPDASDTLYTLIRRLRTVIETNSDLKIETDRGRSYRLTHKDLS